jgi:non-ribosomal peptide synthetase component F
MTFRKEHKGIPTHGLTSSMGLFEKMHSGTDVYHRNTAIDLKGKLDTQSLEKAIRALPSQHEALRSYFVTAADGSLRQAFIPETDLPVSKDWPFKMIDATSTKPSSPSELLDVLKTIGQEKLLTEPFIFEKGPLWRAALVKFAEDHYQLVISFHHAIVDLVSEGIVLRDISQLYAQKPLAEPVSLTKITPPSEEKMAKNLEHWNGSLKDRPELDLRPDRPTTAKSKTSFNGDRVSFELDEKLVSRLEKIVADQKTAEYKPSLHSLYVATIFALMQRYTGQTDITLGTVSSNRVHEDRKITEKELKDAVNCFVNSIPVRVPELSGNMSLLELLKVAHTTASNGYKNQAPLDRIAMHTGIASPFDVMIASNPKKATLQLPGVVASTPVEPNLKKSRLKQPCFNIDDRQVYIEYNPDIFSHEFMVHMQNHWLNMLNYLAEHPNAKISDIPLLDEEERALIAKFNDTKKTPATTLFAHQLFAKRAAENPDGVAYVFHTEDEKKQALTYKEAEQFSNQLALHLRKQGVKPSAPVAISVTRSLKLPMAILSTLKSGGAAFPVETDEQDIPTIHSKLFKTQSELKAELMVVIVDNKTKDLFAKYRGGKIVLVNLDEHEAILSSVREDKVAYSEPKISSNDLAYIATTSGSSGEPKLIQATHGNVRHGVNGLFDREFKGTCGFASASPTFDAFYFELFAPLSVEKGTLHLTFDAGRASPAIVTKVLRDEKIHFAALSSTLVQDLDLSQCTESPYIIAMGSALKEETRNKFATIIHNEYGPAETTWDATRNSNPAGQLAACVGVPKANTQIFVLDEHGNICPPGVPGEIHIAGEGVSPGYLGDKALTQQKFVEKQLNLNTFRFENPTKEIDAKSDTQSVVHMRLYKTGDIGVITKHGLEFVGRKDRQIKRFGVRIELEGIEAILKKMPEVKEVTVIQEPKTGNLIAYLTPKTPSTKIYTKHLNAFLAANSSLPRVARLQGAVCMEALPLNKHGKVNFKALPEYKPNQEEIEHPAKDAHVQIKLRSIWARVLKINEEHFGIDQGFSELGGFSQIFPFLTKTIIEAFDLDPDLNIKDLFTTTDITVQEQSALITKLMPAPVVQKNPPTIRVTSDISAGTESLHAASDELALLSPSALNASGFWKRQNSLQLQVVAMTPRVSTSPTPDGRKG